MKKILVFDIESTDLQANIGHTLCFGYQWLGEKTQMISIRDHMATPYDPVFADALLLEKIKEVMNQADLWVTWFGSLHDEPFLRTRLIINNLKPFLECAHFDGWKFAISKLKMSRNRLFTVNSALTMDESTTRYDKCPSTVADWIRAKANDQTAIQRIEEKCVLDVDKLAHTFKKISPYAGKMIPNFNTEKCRSCDSKDVIRNGFRFKSNEKQQRYLCHSCGHNFALPFKK